MVLMMQNHSTYDILCPCSGFCYGSIYNDDDSDFVDVGDYGFQSSLKSYLRKGRRRSWTRSEDY